MITNKTKNNQRLRIVTIEKIIDETPSIKSFFFRDDMVASGGQFVMVWVPGVDEVPMSISFTEAEKGITVARVGPTTNKLHELEVGAKLGIRGPYGKGFDISKSNQILAVSGGCGSAPLGPVMVEAVSAKKHIKLAIGARTEHELLFRSRAEALGIDLDISTDDGSAGYQGFVTDRVLQLIEENSFDLIVTCGPEVMLKKVVELAVSKNVPVQASLERYMKCGVGVCDACAINGYQVCRDGPVFDGETLVKLTDFGKTRRDATGCLIDV